MFSFGHNNNNKKWAHLKKKKIKEDPRVLRLLQRPAVAPLTFALRVHLAVCSCWKGRERMTQAFRDYMTLGSDPVHLMQRNQHALGGKKIITVLPHPRK